MQTEFLFSPLLPNPHAGASLTVGMAQVPLQFVRHGRARRYILRLTTAGAARVTVPRRGSPAEALRFAQSQIHWLERQLRRRQENAFLHQGWRAGDRILFRGEPVKLILTTAGHVPRVGFADQVVRLRSPFSDLRPAIERHLWALAKQELPGRSFALAAQHGLTLHAVTVRNQKSRWGSCSRRGTVSLNWRLIQTPGSVRDYLICHELMHLREMNHSNRFWRAVATVCPRYTEAEAWLRTHRDLLR